MAKSYSDHIKTGDISPLDAIKMNTVRGGARSMTSAAFAQHVENNLPADAAAFGMLDVIAVRLVEWYGAKEAGDVFRHYAAVCEGRATVDGGEA